MSWTNSNYTIIVWYFLVQRYKDRSQVQQAIKWCKCFPVYSSVSTFKYFRALMHCRDRNVWLIYLCHVVTSVALIYVISLSYCRNEILPPLVLWRVAKIPPMTFIERATQIIELCSAQLLQWDFASAAY